MRARSVFCIAAGLAVIACSSGPAASLASSIVTAQGSGVYEIKVQAWKEEQVNGQVTTAGAGACDGPYREIERRRSVMVCADIPLSQCPPVAWSVTIQCEESA